MGSASMYRYGRAIMRVPPWPQIDRKPGSRAPGPVAAGANSRLWVSAAMPASNFSPAIRENLYVGRLDPAGTIYFREGGRMRHSPVSLGQQDCPASLS